MNICSTGGRWFDLALQEMVWVTVQDPALQPCAYRRPGPTSFDYGEAGWPARPK
jgi:hypothetical protein